MWDNFWDKILESPLLLILVGALFLLFGAVSEFSLSSFRVAISETGWRIALAITGAVLLGIGVWIQKDNWIGMEERSSGVTSLVRWRNELLTRRMATASDVRMLSTSNYALLSESFEEFKAFLRRGGQLKCIYTPPDGQAIQMVAMRSVGVESEIAHLQKQYELTMEALQELARHASEGIQVKTIDYPQGFVLTLIDPLLPTGVALVTINGFGKYYTERPCWILPKRENEEWFQFFFETFENMWHSPHAQLVRISSNA